MNLSSIELWHRISAARIASPVRCREWAAEAARTLSATEATSGLKVLQRLVELGKLSNYQAKILAGQASQPLHVGQWVIRGRLKASIWSGWYELSPPASDGLSLAEMDFRDVSWARLVTPNDLPQLRSIAPSLRRLRKLAQLRHAHLQPVFAPERIDAGLLIRVSPVAGPLLTEVASGKRLSMEQVLGLLRPLISALASLHQNRIVHGRVLPDRVVMHESSPTLIVDPLGAATNVENITTRGLLGDQLGPLRTQHFIAPEFQAPAQWPNFATDVYMLGCLWWWLHVGRPPVSGSSVDEVFRAHADRAPALPRECELPPPLARCLSHCLARNVAARFSNAVELQAAFDVAEKMLQPAPAAIPQPLAMPRPAAELEAAVDAGGTVAVRARRRKSASAWLLPVVGSGGLLILLLLALMFSGALKPASKSSASLPGSAAGYQPKQPVELEPVAGDPRLQHYQIVASGEDLLWVPPAGPSPIPIDLLPPGGQLFFSFRPSLWLDSDVRRELIQAFGNQLTPLLALVSKRAGQPVERIEQVTLVFYGPQVIGQAPQFALRCQLEQALPVTELQAGWSTRTEASVGERALLLTGNELAYFVPWQTTADRPYAREFSVGPIELMQDVVDLEGARGPLLLPMEKLWKKTDRFADMVLLVAPAYLLTDGRGLLANGPRMFSQQIKELLGTDTRAVALQMRLEPNWYVETQWMGSSAMETSKLLVMLQDRLRGLPAAVEAWLVSEPPHAYWRALAQRFPNMLRTMVNYARYGVEDGVAVANVHLPATAATNILLAAWVAVQEGSTISEPAAASPSFGNGERALSFSEYLERPISLRFEQQPIEMALRLVEDEANEGLPEGTPKVKFRLDGAAFQKAGITRNQQLRDFQHDNKSVRAALTEIAKRGNPVTTVTDTRQVDQRLIWVVVDAPSSPGVNRILLTTREFALAANIELPPEFTP